MLLHLIRQTVHTVPKIIWNSIVTAGTDVTVYIQACFYCTVYRTQTYTVESAPFVKCSVYLLRSDYAWYSVTFLPVKVASRLYWSAHGEFSSPVPQLKKFKKCPVKWYFHCAHCTTQCHKEFRTKIENKETLYCTSVQKKR